MIRNFFGCVPAKICLTCETPEHYEPYPDERMEYICGACGETSTWAVQTDRPDPEPEYEGFKPLTVNTRMVLP